MEGLSTRVYKGLKGYWQRRGYERLDGTTKPRPRRRWRVRVSPRFRLRLRGSPKKWYRGLRDAYVRIMMKLANSSVVRGRAMGADNAFGVTPAKEYDQKMIIEICKALAMGQSQQIPSHHIIASCV